MDYLLFIALCVAILVCLIVGIKRYDYLDPFYLKLFVPYIFGNLLVELIGFASQLWTDNNNWLFNIATPIEFLFIFFVFYNALDSLTIKRTILIFMPVYALSVIINETLIQGFKVFHTYTFLIGALATVICCSLFLYQMLRTENNVKPTTMPMFWIATGYLFFYAGTFIIMSILNTLIGEDIALAKNLFIIVKILNIFLYVIVTISFLCQEATPISRPK